MQPNPPSLEALELALARATKGPWTIVDRYPDGYEAGTHMEVRSGDATVVGVWARHADDSGLDARDEDLALICALRNSAEALLAAARDAERLRAALEKYGRHSKEPWCSKWAGKFNVIDPDRTCDCGLEAALAGQEPGK